ncbi:MAG: hypothetical protein PHH47_08120 [Gallionella sp.]|nr:hypothetical protein [Gallionella sp.]MDD4947263.1 hypothetical protein [Gallionella sp.]MDD5612754.1 hypothetical protein [Gallionella sp.]
MEFFEQSDNNNWTPVTATGLAGYAVAALLVLWLAHGEYRWVFVLDSANLAFHEAGHPLFGMLNDRLTVYGGTLAQLLFPLAVLVSFYRQRATFSCAFAVLWLGDNLFNIAVYMADARTQVLPLVGNGEHDWTEIFSRWGVLQWDTGIAATVRLTGWLVVIGAGLWLGYRKLAEDA